MSDYDPELDDVLSDLNGEATQQEDEEPTEADKDFDYWEGQMEDSFHERNMD